MKKSKENLSKLGEAIDLMERHIKEQKKQHEKLLAAELKSRFML